MLHAWGRERCLQGFDWEDLGISGRITLRWTLGRQGSMERTGFGCLRIGPVAGFCEHGNEPSGSIKKAGYCLKS
jgi:hypothetical protein